MSNIDNEILLGAEEDAKEVEFILNYIGSENREKLSEEDIYYCLDVMLELLDKICDSSADDDTIEVDTEDIAKNIQKKAKKEGMGPYDIDTLTLIVEAELEYNEQFED
ncbi:MAG: hypothetical protein MJZ41_03320 [Bacteroidaceae bacterium]|nr:hypothetical protein [Bacteroidaceae bacterium]